MRFNQVLRRLAKMPLFTGVAVFTLALGIGANTAIFSVVEGVLLKPLPYPQSDEVVTVDHAANGLNLPRTGAAPFLYFTYREDGRAFQDVGLWSSGTVSVTGLAEPEEVPTLFVTDGVLPILRVQPMLGRLFTKADDSPGTAETVVLTAGYWRSKFGADRSAVGRTITVNGTPREIVGVLPDSFRFLDRSVSLVLPQRFDRSKVVLGNFSYTAIARLKPGVSIQDANADVGRMIPISLTRFPPFAGLSVKVFEEARLAPRVRSLKTDLVGDVQTALWVLMGMIAMVLLIACANVANLLLVRADSRQQELAVRAALGAGAGQIARELLVESVTLGVLGGIVGLGLAFAALRFLVSTAPGNLPRIDEIAIDVPVLLFTLALSLAAGLLFGAIPVFKYAGPRIGSALRGGGRAASASKERHRARNTLVVAQVALALVLLVSSGLMIRTFRALRSVHPGFTQPEQVQTFRLTIPPSQVKDETATVRMHQAIMDKIAAVPGVTSVALTSVVTMTGQGWHDPLYAQDRVYSESQIPPIRLFKFVTPGFMTVMGGSIVAGRDLTWDDLYERRASVMVSESLSRELWGSPSAAIGKRVRPYATGPWREVVGVVSDMRDDGLHEKAAAAAYWPMHMSDFDPSPDSRNFVQRSMTYVVRSRRTGTAGFVDELGRAAWSVNSNLPLANVRTLREIYDRALARTSFTLVLLSIAGAMALLLGIAGIYGVISYSVSQRTREIGIRVALGARDDQVTRMFVGQGVVLAGIGIAIGLTAALAVTRLMSSLLFQIRPLDPATYAAVSLTLLGATALASYVPALRATAVDPVEALRAE
jgi:putative ABC transport system permease protein